MNPAAPLLFVLLLSITALARWVIQWLNRRDIHFEWSFRAHQRPSNTITDEDIERGQPQARPKPNFIDDDNDEQPRTDLVARLCRIMVNPYSKTAEHQPELLDRATSRNTVAEASTSRATPIVLGGLEDEGEREPLLRGKKSSQRAGSQDTLLEE